MNIKIIIFSNIFLLQIFMGFYTGDFGQKHKNSKAEHEVKLEDNLELASIVVKITR